MDFADKMFRLQHQNTFNAIRTSAKLKNRLSCVLLVLFTASQVQGQPSDFFSLKKGSRTIRHYFAGSFIEFIHRNGNSIYGNITQVRNDSFYITQYDVRMLPNPWGTRTADTVASYMLRFHYEEIAAIPKPEKSLEFIRNGSLLMIGGTAYAFLHTTNGLIFKKKIYPTTILISGGVAAVGYGMRKLRKYYYSIGKKYQLTYIRLRST